MKNILFFSALLFSSTLFSQCYPDRHNTSWNEGWRSCTTRANPNPIRGNSNWIMYDFGHSYLMTDIHMWNINDPKKLDDGFRRIAVDYSLDGAVWTHLGNFTLQKGTGSSFYEGQYLGSFNGDTARFVILTQLTNWGGDCGGFSEVKITTLDAVVNPNTTRINECMSVGIYPNPHSDAFNISIVATCIGKISWTLYNHLGQEIIRGNLGNEVTTLTQNVPTGGLAPGLYHLVLKQNGKIGRYPVVKM